MLDCYKLFAVLLFLKAAVLSNKLYGYIFGRELEVFCAVLGAEKKPYFVSSW